MDGAERLTRDMPELLPWQHDLRQTAADAIVRGRLGQAVLFVAPPGVGAGNLASSVCAALACWQTEPSGYACGECQGCRLFHAGTHPDLVTLEPAETGGEIKVDQVRAFTDTMRLTPQYATGRIGWIDPLDRLNRSAANSALKILEEPPASSAVLAVTERISAVLPTITSRFSTWRVSPPDPETGRLWLSDRSATPGILDGDSLRTPLATAERGSEDNTEWIQRWDADLARILSGRASVSGVAERACDAPPALWLDWLYRRISSILAIRLGALGASTLPQRLAATITVGALSDWQSLAAEVAEACRFRYTNADWQLVIESVLLKVETVVSKTR